MTTNLDDINLSNPKAMRFYSSYVNHTSSDLSEHMKLKEIIIESKIITGIEDLEKQLDTVETIEVIARKLLNFFDKKDKVGNQSYVSLFFEEYNLYVEMTKERLKSLSLSFNSSMESLGLTPEKINQSMIEVGKAIANTLSDVIPKDFGMNFSGQKVLAPLIEALKIVSSKIEKFQLIAAEYDWFIDLESEYSVDLQDLIIDLHETGEITENKVDEIFLEYYDCDVILDTLDALITQNKFPERKPILLQIRKAYSLQLYYLLVPTLLAQTEGLIAKSFQHVGHMGGKELNSYISQMFSGKYNQALRNFFFERILASFKHGKDIESSISRHAILHGADTNYASESNVVKLILILNMILNSN